MQYYVAAAVANSGDGTRQRPLRQFRRRRGSRSPVMRSSWRRVSTERR